MEAYNGNLYLIGGNSSGTVYRNDVQVAPINGDGTLGAWRTTTAFTGARGNHATVISNGRLYVISGYDGTNYRTDIQFAPILP